MHFIIYVKHFVTVLAVKIKSLLLLSYHNEAVEHQNKQDIEETSVNVSSQMLVAHFFSHHSDILFLKQSWRNVEIKNMFSFYLMNFLTW